MFHTNINLYIIVSRFSHLVENPENKVIPQTTHFYYPQLSVYLCTLIGTKTNGLLFYGFSNKNIFSISIIAVVHNQSANPDY